MRPIHIEKFKIYEEEINQHQYFDKLVDERVMFEVFPQMMDYEMLESTMRDIPAYARPNIIAKDGTLMRTFETQARVHNTNKDRIRWRLYVAEGDIRATVLENVDPNLTQPGLHGSVFSIKLDVDWFGPNDALIFEGFRELPVLVTTAPQAHGQGFIYDVKVIGADDLYFPPELLAGGNRVMQAGSFIGEDQVKRGNIHFGLGEAFLEFEVPMTRMGWEMKVTDKAHQASKNYRMVPQVTDARPDTGQPDILVNSLELKFMSAVNYQKDLWLTYGRSAGQFAGKFLDGLSRRELKIGPGLFEFLEAAYIYDYPIEAGGLDMFIDFLSAAWHDKVDPQQRNVDIYTGTGGLKLWQKWCQLADQYGIVQLSDLNYSQEEALFPQRKGVGINVKQYRSVFIEPFGKITVHYMPMLDSEQVETRKYKNLPITSYEFIVFNYGYGTGPDSNIYVMRNEETEQYGYGIGAWSPMGPSLNKPGVSGRFLNTLGKENAYEYIHDTEFGILVKDVSYILWFRPAFS